MRQSQLSELLIEQSPERITAQELYSAWYQAYQEIIVQPYRAVNIPTPAYPTWQDMQREASINSNASQGIALYERMAQILKQKP